jgi:hypothetical protein
MGIDIQLNDLRHWPTFEPVEFAFAVNNNETCARKYFACTDTWNVMGTQKYYTSEFQ